MANKKKTTKKKSPAKKYQAGGTSVKNKTSVGGPYMAQRGDVRRKNEAAAEQSRKTGKAVDIVTKDGRTEKRRFY